MSIKINEKKASISLFKSVKMTGFKGMIDAVEKNIMCMLL